MSGDAREAMVLAVQSGAALQSGDAQTALELALRADALETASVPALRA
jgi:hypothetical protein